MAGCDYESPLGFDLAFIQAQGADSYTSEATVPVAADAMRVRSVEITHEVPVSREADRNGTVSKGGSVVGMRGGAFKVALSARAGGAVATEADHAVALKTGPWSGTVSTPTATTINGAWSAYNTGDVASAAGLSVGDVVGFTDSDGAVWGRVISAIATNTITLATPLHFLPADGSAVTASKTYSLTSTCEGRAFSLWAPGDHSAQKAGGCIPQTIRYQWGSGEAPTIEISGPIREYRQASSTTLDGAILIGATTMVVDEWKHISKNMALTIQAEGANSAEAVLVTAAPSSSTITIQRDADGAGASAHGDGAVIVPFVPSVAASDLHGSTISPAACYVTLAATGDNQAAFMVAESGTLEITGGTKTRDRGHGDTWLRAGFNLAANLVAKINVAAWMSKRDWDLYYDTINATERCAAVQLGDAAGEITYIEMPRAVHAPGSINPGDEEVSATFEAEGRGARSSTSTLGEVIIATL